jgi:hypothetical protein
MAAINQHKPNDYRHRDRVEIKRALISVSDKTGLLELAKALPLPKFRKSPDSLNLSTVV